MRSAEAPAGRGSGWFSDRGNLLLPGDTQRTGGTLTANSWREPVSRPDYQRVESQFLDYPKPSEYSDERFDGEGKGEELGVERKSWIRDEILSTSYQVS